MDQEVCDEVFSDVLEAGGKVYLDESSLWKDTGGKYVTTHLVSSVKVVKADLRGLHRRDLHQLQVQRFLHQLLQHIRLPKHNVKQLQRMLLR